MKMVMLVVEFQQKLKMLIFLKKILGKIFLAKFVLGLPVALL